jgi:hypothetical protein
MADITSAIQQGAGIAGSALLGGSGPSGRASATSLLNNKLRLAEEQRQSDLQLSQLAQEKETKRLTQGFELVKAGLTSKEVMDKLSQNPQDLERFKGIGRAALQGLGQDPSLIDLLQPEAADSAKDFTLGPGQERFDAGGNPIASVAPKSDTLSPEALQQKKDIRAAGRTEINFMDKPPTLNQMANLVGPDGEAPELGESLSELKQKGFTVRSTADQKTDKQARAATATLDTLDKLVDPVFTGQEGAQNRLFDNAINTWNRIGQTDKDLTLFEAFSQGTVASLVRAVGEKGAMSNRDIERGLALIPSAGDGITSLPDTREVAKGKMKQLRQWFDLSLGKGGLSGEPAEATADAAEGELTDEQLLQGF